MKSVTRETPNVAWNYAHTFARFDIREDNADVRNIEGRGAESILRRWCAERRVIVVSRSISRHNKIDTCAVKITPVVESSSKPCASRRPHVSEITRLNCNYNEMQIRAGAAVQLRLAIIRPCNLETDLDLYFRWHRMITTAISEAWIRNSMLFLAAEYFSRRAYKYFKNQIESNNIFHTCVLRIIFQNFVSVKNILFYLKIIEYT